jgi:hypothetical protein
MYTFFFLPQRFLFGFEKLELIFYKCVDALTMYVLICEWICLNGTDTILKGAIARTMK